ncbi:SRR1-like protein-related protein [Trichomonas vaginalis G3]|uniref:SRR1-like protein-related protein n=1 Tax=Trichomonas vaginalis (strain ATCC PRA-98 / G3) TaxID=412133 RepID=A2EFJ9_TRIV3|nr:rhythmic process [Trichomonas vaginalis G3]EAY08593.1 SRR1-like protein-related protein [Trichomonas vaginalis G3]KAI5497894.1 rhythmic process [Trichomonas vaginalis G3]|eukprot:XP_001320816.1 SRR1-like protein-related protein [Trichomonas vaginalis G3]
MSRRNKKGILKQLNVQVSSEEVPELVKSLDVESFPAFKNVKDLFQQKSIKTIYCIGIGDPCKNLAARYQISFIIKIAKELSIEKLKYYDPCTCSDCLPILSQMGFEVLSENSEGVYNSEENTAFYLPHCPAFLYHNLLASNLSLEKFKNLIIIGNSFEEHSKKAKIGEVTYKSLIEETFNKKFIIEQQLNFNDNLFFYNTSSMIANAEGLPEKDDPFWNKRELLPNTIN